MHIIGQCHLNLQPKWLLRVVLGTPVALEADCAATCVLENRKGCMGGGGGRFRGPPHRYTPPVHKHG